MAVNMSKKDEEALAAAGAAWNAANAAGDEAGKAAAHAQAEAIRASYGYSGGGDGSRYIPTVNQNQYTPVDNSGNDYASMSGMSDLHKAALESAGSAWQAANESGDRAGMDAAHAQAEAIRALYGYSGGGDGSEYIPIPKQQTGGFSYDSAPSYTDKYSAQIDDLLNQILNREDFSYDALNDPLYQQYRTQYQREGQRALQDTLGQASARTGGLASSYATTAAQQASDYYASQVADKIPELYQLAYSMYLDDKNSQVQDLGLLQQMSDTQYNRYRDTMSDWYNDRNFAYGVYRDDIADQKYSDELSWNRGSYTSETEYKQALAKAQTLAAAGDFSGYKSLGYTDAEIATLKSAYDREQALKNYSGGRSAGGRNHGNGSGGNKWSAVEDWVSRFGNDAAEDYIKENYKALGYSSQSAALSGWRNHLLEGGGQGKTDNAVKIRNSLELMRGQTGSKSAIANSIAAYVVRGELTDAEARYLFEYFGYDPEEWLE